MHKDGMHLPNFDNYLIKLRDGLIREISCWWISGVEWLQPRIYKFSRDIFIIYWLKSQNVKKYESWDGKIPIFHFFFLVILIAKLVFWWTDGFKEMKIFSEVEGADEPGLYHSFNKPVQCDGLQFL